MSLKRTRTASSSRKPSKQNKRQKVEAQPSDREIFLEPPFRLMTVARSQTGKTTLLIKIMLWKWIKQFDRIHIFTPTFFQDKKWSALDKHVKSGKVVVHSVFDEDVIKRIWAKCIKLKEKGKTFHTLLFFDDCVGQKGFKTNQETGLLNQIVCRANHANISTAWLVQKLTQCSTIMRSQAEGVILFSCLQEKEQKSIYQEFGMGKSSSFCEMLGENTSLPYHYVYINRQGPGKPDYYHNFNKIDLTPYICGIFYILTHAGGKFYFITCVS